MKKKFLLAAMLAGLGFGGSANAVHVNPDGLGQVLLYPYYTVQNGFDTYVHVVNTTDRVKAVKVRFLEGMNSSEVLDFNLYLSPYDVWTGVITRTDTGAKVASSDTSCIAPRQLPAGGEAFRNSEYALDTTNTVSRTREGYIEIIEMGVVNDSFVLDTVNVADAATHVHNADGTSVPLNCTIVRKAASATISGGGQFNTNQPSYISAPTGGLYGFASVINVNAGLKTSFSATALDNFADVSPIHYAPGNTLPSLEQVTTDGDIISGANVYQFPLPARLDRRIDAVSAVLMRDQIFNDYVVDAGRDSKTDWVITFPTKRYYVNNAGSKGNTNEKSENGSATPPFYRSWAGGLNLGDNVPRGGACDPISLAYWNREERQHTVVVEEDFSPVPEVLTPELSLCREVNTLSFLRSGDSGASTLFGSLYTAASFTLAEGFDSGWARVGFSGQLTSGGLSLTGLPVIGFSAISNTNSVLEIDGQNVLSNYLGSVEHKASRAIIAPLP